MIAKRLAAVLTVVICVTGCGSSYESKLIGNWRPRPTSVLANTFQGIRQGDSGGSAPPTAAGVTAMAKMSLSFRDDKTFTLDVGSPMEGTWTVDEGSGLVDMTLTKVAGQALPASSGGAAPPKMTCQFDNDTSNITLKNPDPNTAGPGAVDGLNFEKEA